MIMADVLKIALLVVGAQMIFVSFWLLARALMPARVERFQACYRDHPVRTSLAGLIKGGIPFAIGLVALKTGAPALKLIGFLLVSFVVIAGLFGSAGLAQSVGQGLARPLDAAEPWRPVLRGGVVIVLALLLPLAGWFVLLPLLLISGAGAMLARGRSAAVPEMSVAAAAAMVVAETAE